jgi:hypothetical protein
MTYITGPDNSIKRITKEGYSNDSSSCKCKGDCNCHEKKNRFPMKYIIFLLLLAVLGSVFYYLYTTKSK